MRVPIEYESAHKSIARYMNFVKKYYQRHDTPIILIIYNTQSIMKKIERAEKTMVESKASYSFKFFYISLNDLLKIETPKFVNCVGDELVL